MRNGKNFEGVCPCCGRHCPADSLHCSRGQDYFSRDAESDLQMKKFDKHESGRGFINDETILLMLKCGHYLHHGQIESGDDLLSFLSDEERKELTELLKKCIEQWNITD